MTLVSPSLVRERLYTAEDLLAMPPNARFELIDGRLVPMAPTGGDHGFTTADLTVEIGGFVRRNGLGRCTAAETGYLLARNPDVVLAPDFAFVAKNRLPDSRVRGFVPIAPDLVIETRSPNDCPRVIAKKIERWLSYGVRVVIDVDTEKQTLILHRPGIAPITLEVKDILTLPELLPGFNLPMSEVF